MITFNGKYNTANVMIDQIDPTCAAQIVSMINHPALTGSTIVIMSDTHAGSGSVIGFTMPIGDRIVPNIVGVDIGCSIGGYFLPICAEDVDFKKLDNFIRTNIPSGFNKHAGPQGTLKDPLRRQIQDVCSKTGQDFYVVECAIGTLGRGNHFIELNKSKTGNIVLVIHTGSRNFGLQVCGYHQRMAIKHCGAVYGDLAYLEGDTKEEYLSDMRVAQEYAALNRHSIANRLCSEFFLTEPTKQIDTVHNYINFEDKIIRKGAIQAHLGQELLIPLNMRDGTIVAIGKGNPAWNLSAPHGAGRKMSRSAAKKKLCVDTFREQMKGIWTSCISKHTLDEAPDAYKKADAILDNLEETAEIIEIIKPIYNFKG